MTEERSVSLTPKKKKGSGSSLNQITEGLEDDSDARPGEQQVGALWRKKAKFRQKQGIG